MRIVHVAIWVCCGLRVVIPGGAAYIIHTYAAQGPLEEGIRAHNALYILYGRAHVLGEARGEQL